LIDRGGIEIQNWGRYVKKKGGGEGFDSTNAVGESEEVREVKFQETKRDRLVNRRGCGKKHAAQGNIFGGKINCLKKTRVSRWKVQRGHGGRQNRMEYN